LDIKGFAMVYNPLNVAITRTLTLPLYYTGIRGEARIREQEGPLREYRLNRRFEAQIQLQIPAQGVTWLTIK
ncbi:MAG: hypothetical protein KGM47_09935, partial [Acidobacteriota bacterium]|nr:hypothetical protein [Acidobacteriota bacterium]